MPRSWRTHSRRRNIASAARSCWVCSRGWNMKINVTGLKKYFGTTRAVDGVTFEFSGGQIFGFIGPNGAGKTTTMRILATLDEPTGGDCFIDGISVTEEP